MDLRRPRCNSSSIDEDGNVLWHGVKLVEFRKTDMHVAINKSNRREDASFTVRMGKTGTALPYQQVIPTDFARSYKNLFQKTVTLEGPTGQTWRTVIRDSYHMVRFGRGWRRFSVENHLREGYQLLFTLAGRFRFLVQFFDHLGKRCTSYPPLPGSQPVAQTQRQPDLQPGSQQVVDGGQASHRHGSEVQSSAAFPLMGTPFNSAVPLNSVQDNVILRQRGPDLPSQQMRELEEQTFDAVNDSDDMEMEDDENQELDEAQSYNFQGSDIDEVPIYPSPATMQPVNKPERNIPTLNELSGRKQSKFHTADNQARSPQIQDDNGSPSSGDELPLQFYPEMQHKNPVTRKRPSPVSTPVASYHEAGGSSGSSPAIRVLQQQGCMRFSDIVLKCERRDVSDQERRVVVEAARRFVSALENEKFVLVMRDEQVYHRFHLAIPGRILEATGTERASKVEVWLMDREQALYKTHSTRPNFYELPLLDHDAWAKFAVDHALEEGDVCVFQLLHSKPAVSMPAFLFCVHIFRVVEISAGHLNFSDAFNNK